MIFRLKAFKIKSGIARSFYLANVGVIPNLVLLKRFEERDYAQQFAWFPEAITFFPFGASGNYWVEIFLSHSYSVDANADYAVLLPFINSTADVVEVGGDDYGEIVQVPLARGVYKLIYQERYLQAGSSFDFTVGFPQVPVDARRYPDIAAHVVDAWSYGYPRVLTIDRDGSYTRFGLTPDERSRQSIARYKSNPSNPRTTFFEEYDEYPQALFAENGGTAHVRPVENRQNEGAGSTIGNFARSFQNGAKIEIITNYVE
jgi:hypothetical protein